jgi:hypothetical protein
MSAIESRIISSFFHLPPPWVGQSPSAVSTSLRTLAFWSGVIMS